MNIKKHGNLSKEEAKTEEFKCEQCGCEFDADYDEYYVEKGSCLTTASSLTYVYNATVSDTYITVCPECHKVVTKTKQRTVSNITTTYSGTASTKINETFTSDACENCTNNPKNGGSGICNCTLGSPKVKCEI